jgi:hypothetical protein
MAGINAMVDSAKTFIESLRETEPAIWQAFQPDGGQSEIVMVWDDNGTLCKIRPDRISRDNRIIIDAKFTGVSAEPNGWVRQMMSMGYHISAAFYRRGIETLFDVQPAYCFLVVENKAPYLCSLIGTDPATFDLGGQMVSSALASWAQCMKRGEWPGYPNRVTYPELPSYEVSKWEDRKLCGNPYDPAILWRKP